MLFGRVVDLDRGIFAAMLLNYTYPKEASLSTHMAKMLRTQSTMIQLHWELIEKGDISHINFDSSEEYTVFEDGIYVLLEPATGKPKDRLHSFFNIGPYR